MRFHVPELPKLKQEPLKPHIFKLRHPRLLAPPQSSHPLLQCTMAQALVQLVLAHTCSEGLMMTHHVI